MSDKVKKFRSNWFRVAVEGATCDGRTIERSWLEDIASSYDPDKYGARIFIEHIRGLNPEWGFRCMGDVLAVKTDTVKIDGQDRLALFAQIEPTPEFVAMTKAKQKIYSSIEVDPNFAGTGKAYLRGLGVTDSPASLGTEMIQFAASNPEASPLRSRKQSPGNYFSVAIESDIEFEEVEEKPSALEALFARFDALLKPKAPEQPPPPAPAAPDLATFTEAVAALGEHVRKQEQRFAASEHENADLRRQLQSLAADFAAVKQRLEGTVDHAQASRPVVTGAGRVELTDC
ncbi:GPO family capsid scaffolding protein [Vulcaniibacterium tengchongense]|uniref:Capsid scaffolding serine peptidase GPO n=1 Tax=Vulcaniibacterium tengchongense TaxID=1273429 RepID=A0A3N4VNG1_9GAMM|nr:GPO family capsid scaffolding protein [Vulcaniibacterium tengchongense]RPE74614.1 capsid scaffolding serine peptidase GPO [Vulcaniibacterium tengchongense]